MLDDDEVLAAALRRGLTAEGSAVEIAVDGPDGPWRGRGGSYDAVLLDIMLPGADGYQVCAALRRRLGRGRPGPPPADEWWTHGRPLTWDPRCHRAGARVARTRPINDTRS